MVDIIKTRAPKLTPLEKRLMLDASLPAIAGQVLWLDAADATTVRDGDGDNAATGTGGANNGFSGTVATWVDKSGSGFNVTNTTANQQPIYTIGGLNGNNVLTFDGSNDKLRNTTAVIGGDDYTMFIVFDRSIAAGRDGVFEMGSGGSRNALFVNDSANKLGMYTNGTFFNSTNTYTAGTYEIVTMMHDVTSLKMWRNNSQEINATGSTRVSTTGLYVGDDSSGGDELNGHIAEIIVYDRDLSADERHDVETYLAGKWGRTITNTAPTLNTNTGATVSQSDPVTITAAMLSSSDADNSESNLRYTITDLSDYGTLTNSNTLHTYALGEYFTQGDIDNGYIVYTHGGTANFTDSFSFTVTDQYATTAAATFNLTITPDNIAPQFQGWTLVSSEDFQTNAAGWSDTFRETSNPYLTTFLGRHSQEGGAQNTYKTYAMTGTQDYTVLTFDMYKLDSWDGEFFRVFIDDNQVINLSMTQGSFQTFPDGSSGVVSYTVQELTPFAANFTLGSWNDQIIRFTLTVQNSAAATMKLGFSSTLDQAISDESWGVDNINIYEVNEGGTVGPFGISENSANGTVVGQVTATDADVGQTITYSISGGTGAGIFAINASTGVITVANSAALDYESATSYTLDIVATDNGTPAMNATQTMTINVLDLPENTAPTIAALGPLTIAENTANGTVIGTAMASDAEGNTITYSISAGNTDNIFAINSTTGAIRVNSNANLNYEWDNSYTLTIRAQDNGFGNLASTRNVIVNVTSINEAPTFDIPQSFLNENPYLRYNATTGNFYQYVSTTTSNAAANTAASSSLLNGIAGHLVTISDAAENAYVRALGSGALWLGGTDAVAEGEWVWGGTGPEGGQVFSIGSVAQGAYYTNWVAGQPDDVSNSDFLEMATSGQWTDVNGGNRAYVIEWEGAAVMAALGNGPFTMAENPTMGQSVGFVHARDADAGDTLTYSITGGSGAALFAVNASTGEITVSNTAIDYETTTSYTLDMRVQDAGGLFNTQTVTINITNVNEAPVLNPGGPFTVTENAANNTVVGTMSATDVDASTTLTYSITSGDPRGVFSINSAGQIRVANTNYLDYELQGVYTLNIRVSDGSLTDNETVTINLTNVNEGPSFDAVQRVLASDPTLKYSAATGNFYRYISATANYNTAESNAAAALLNGQAGYVAAVDSLAESNFIRTIIPTTIWVNGTDVAVEGEWRYTSGPKAGELFWLGNGSGSAQNGNYTAWTGSEPNNSGGNEDAIEFRTNGTWNDTNISGARAYVIEWNGADVIASLGNGPYNLAENPANGQSVGFANARDPDSGDTLTYSVTGGTGAAIFAINASTGEITVTDPSVIDYEATTSYTLDLRVQDAGGLFHTQTVTINITDANDAPDLQGWTLVSSEDFEGGASGWSDNTTTTNTFLTRYLGRHSQEGGAQNTFKTYALSGTQDYTILSFDFYRLDSWETEQFRIFIDDVMVFNDTFTAAYKVVADGSLGSVSWTVQEISGAAANIAYASQNDQMMRFTLKIDNNAAGSIKLGFSSNLNSAVSNEAWGVDNIDIYEVKDGGTPGAFHVVEGMANGTLVGTLTASDQDAADTHSYSITSGTGAGIFSINAATGAITLSNTASVDYETTTSYTLTVRVTDNGTPALYDEETITINVLDRPENNAPVLTPLGTITISENTANGTVIADANATDVNGDTITYSIASGNTDNIFSINATTGVISVNNNANLNREWDSSYTLQIRATDNGFGSLYQNRNLVVNISNVNEAPTFDIPQSFLNENPYLRYNPATGNFYQYVNSAVSNAAANTAATSSLLNGVAGHLVTISDAAENAYVRALGGNVIWLGGRDSVTEGQWVWDGTGPEGGQVFSIGSAAQSGFYTNWQAGQPDNASNSDFLFMQTNGTWADINGGSRRYVIEWEGADVMATLGNGPYSIAEHAPVGQSVGFVHARDADVGDTITYSITGGTGAGKFAIDSSTGEITLAAGVNYEAQNSYTLNLRVQDAGGLFDTRTVTINITDENDAPTMINVTGGHIVENKPIGSLVGRLSTVDEDSADTHIYTMLSDPSGKFTLVNGNEIRTTGAIDYELNQSFSITLRTDDGNGGTFDRMVTITVGDQMDTYSPPPASGGGGVSDPFVPVEEEDQSSGGNILSASLGGERGQSQAFYGTEGQQILRENLTFEIREILGHIEEEEGRIFGGMDYEGRTGDLLEAEEVTERRANFTNIREALQFLQQMADGDQDAEDAEAREPADKARAAQLPPNTIDRQFVDVMTYHQDRAARLREALRG